MDQQLASPGSAPRASGLGRDDVPGLLLQAARIADQLADIAGSIDQGVAAAYFSHGAEILKAHADLVGDIG